MSSTGEQGERKVIDFLDNQFSKIFSFPNPKTKSGAEVADVLVWLNRFVFLVEVKSRDDEQAQKSTINWIRSRIQQGVNQITRNYERIENKERILLHNDYYHVDLDCEELAGIYGIVILSCDDIIALNPSDFVNDIYDKKIPIHVFLWSDFEFLKQEIDTIPDLRFYLQDREDYHKTCDIPLGTERSVLGYYKAHSNNFPSEPTDFESCDYWQQYLQAKRTEIDIRDRHNEFSEMYDKLENIFTDKRKLFDGLPLGLYFAWELGALSRRERAYFGKKFLAVQKWFQDGNTSRKYSLLNCSTGNWHVFHFSIKSDQDISLELEKQVRYRLIKEVHFNRFNLGAYGFGFQVSPINPHPLKGLVAAIVIGADEVKGKYSDDDLQNVIREIGDNSSYSEQKIEEFPDPDELD